MHTYLLHCLLLLFNVKTTITVEDLHHTLNSGCALAVIVLDEKYESTNGIIPQLIYTVEPLYNGHHWEPTFRPL